MLSKAMSLLLFTTAISANVYAGVNHKDHQNGHIHQQEKISIGKPGHEEKVTRTILIEMDDTMLFSPSKISVKKGENIKFIVKNIGNITHELVVGNPTDLKAHAEMMRKMPSMVHEEKNQVSVKPGKTKELVWKFIDNKTVDFACLEPGHFEAGMKGQFLVGK